MAAFASPFFVCANGLFGEDLQRTIKLWPTRPLVAVGEVHGLAHKGADVLVEPPREEHRVGINLDSEIVAPDAAVAEQHLPYVPEDAGVQVAVGLRPVHAIDSLHASQLYWNAGTPEVGTGVLGQPPSFTAQNRPRVAVENAQPPLSLGCKQLLLRAARHHDREAEEGGPLSVSGSAAAGICCRHALVYNRYLRGGCRRRGGGRLRWCCSRCRCCGQCRY
mmetsp:Transcript_79025/g.218732  ORF Transcript_79025/g.218732 Transcript_79025/m.218732 type:complete len:220 (+) Transcript_79025:803-1462(+)